MSPFIQACMRGVVPSSFGTFTLSWYFCSAMTRAFKMLKFPTLAAWKSAVFPFLSVELRSKFPASSKNSATISPFCFTTAVDKADKPLLSVTSIFAPRFNKREAMEIASESGSTEHSWIKAVLPSLSFEFKLTPKSIKDRTCLKRRSLMALFKAAIFYSSLCYPSYVIRKLYCFLKVFPFSSIYQYHVKFSNKTLFVNLCSSWELQKH